MLKRFGLSTLAVAAALAVAAPGVSLARDRGGAGGRDGGQQRHAVAQQRNTRGGFGRNNGHAAAGRLDNRGAQYRGGTSFNFGAGFYNPVVPVYTPPLGVYSPAPAATGYYDQYGIWHAYGYYDQFGIWQTYGY